MAAQNTDKLRKVARKWVGQVGAGGVENGTVTTVPLASTANLLTETAIMITIDRVDANGVLTPDKEEGIIGVVSGDNLSSCIRGVEGTAQAHSAGAVVEVLWTAKNVNDIVDAILAEHSQSGAHTTDTISEKTEDAGVTVDGVKMKDSAIFATQPSCQVKISAAVMIANATPTDVSFNTEDWDTHGFHDNTTNPDRITIPTGLGGRYLVIFNVSWASSGAGSRWILLKNQGGSAVAGTETIHDGETGAYGVYIYTETAIANLTAGEYYRFQVRQDSGGNLNLQGAMVTLYKLP